MKQWKKAFLGVVCFFTLALLSFSRANDMNQNTMHDLVASLNAFASNHGLSDDQMEDLLGKLVINDAKVSKGGVGIVDKEIFIELNSKRNTLILRGQRWQGKLSEQNEVVLVDGQRVLGPSDKFDVAQLRIIVFSPNEVRYIDLSKNRGGTYRR